MTIQTYPAIEGLEIQQGRSLSHVLYAWTPNKDIRKQFKAQRDMNKFREVIHEIPKEDFDQFSDQYSDTFLENRAITTKIIENGIINTDTVFILTTSQELETVANLNYEFTNTQLTKIANSKLYIKECYFSDVYKKILEFFRFDDVVSYACPLEENSIPFNIVTEDTLAIYTHFYHNTYRKDID